MKKKKLIFLIKKKLYDIIKPNEKMIASYIENIYKIWKKFYFYKKTIDEKVKKVLQNKNLSFYQKKRIYKSFRILLSK